MPKLVKMTTNIKFKGSGPKNDANIPGDFASAFCALGSEISASPARALFSPPLDDMTAIITALIPASMIIP